MKYQHYKSDFSSVHQFFRKEGDKDLQIAVPDHVRLTFFTEERLGAFVAERNGDKMTGCSLSEDGKTLTTSIPLSRICLGTGELFCEIAVITPDSNFLQQERIEVTPVKMGVTLWRGKSDDGTYVQITLGEKGYISTVKVYQGDNSTILSEEKNENEVVFKVGSIQKSQVLGLEDDLSDINSALENRVCGVKVSQVALAPDKEGNVNINLGSSLSYDEDKINVVWNK